MADEVTPPSATEPSAEADSTDDEPQPGLRSDSFGKEPRDAFHTAMRWSEVFRNTPQYRSFFGWLSKNIDDQRPDMRDDLLARIQRELKPGQVPPPLRKWIFRQLIDAEEE